MELRVTDGQPRAGPIVFTVLMIALVIWLVVPVGPETRQSRLRAIKVAAESLLLPFAFALVAAWLVLRGTAASLSTLPGVGVRSASAPVAEALTYMVGGFAGTLVAALFRQRLLRFRRLRVTVLGATAAVLFSSQFVFVSWITGVTISYSPDYVTFSSVASILAIAFLLSIPLSVASGVARPEADRAMPRVVTVVLSITFLLGAVATWFVRARLLETAVIWW
jgi:hypothetical protein